MSAFLSINASNKLTVMSDAATYTDDGVLTHIGSKLVEVPNMCAVMTQIGPAGYGGAILDFMADCMPMSFDRLVSVLPQKIKAFERSTAAAVIWKGRLIQYQLFVAGWSESRNAAEAYQIFGRDMPVRADMPGQRPYKLMKSGPIVVEGPQAIPPIEFVQWLEDIPRGQSSLSKFNPVRHGVSCFEAMRAAKSTLVKNPSGLAMHHVGGFVELVEISALGLERNIVKKWDDQVGERINPFREPRPQFFGVQTFAHMPSARTNHGLANTPNGAFQTIQKAISVVAALDLSIYNVTIQLADGTYNAGATVNGAWTGSGKVTLLGNITTPSNVHINLTSGTCITANNNGSITLSGMKISSASGGFGIYAQNGASVTVGQGFEFGAFGTSFESHVVASLGAAVQFFYPYTISGSAYNHMYSLLGGVITADGVTVTLTGTPAFAGGYVRAYKLGNIEYYGATFNGSATGPRYSSLAGSSIDTAGAGPNYFPGNSAGTATTGYYL